MLLGKYVDQKVGLAQYWARVRPHTCVFSLTIATNSTRELLKTYTIGVYSISGRAKALLWVFIRPETYSLLQVAQQRAPIGLREPEPIHAPTLKKVVEKRIETFPTLF